MTRDRQGMVVSPARRLQGTLEVPGDKSISHRYALLGAIADGQTRVSGYAPGADCAATLACLEALGVAIAHGAPGAIVITGRGPRGLRAPAAPLDARNSGTTLRLLAGILAAHPFAATIVGDESLTRRPMRRVVEPLSRMGARFESADGCRPPLYIEGAALTGIDYELPIPSAQVKSAVLLAGLQAHGTTTVREPVPTRDHTERALRAFGIEISRRGQAIHVVGGQRPCGTVLAVPGDPSSAAFFGIAAAALAGSDVEIFNVGVNPTRLAWLDVLRRAGALVEISVENAGASEPSGRIRVRHEALRSIAIGPGEVPGVIDELPALAALATHGGEIIVTGASELRAKESDRITALVTGLRALGADADELPDGFHVRGASPLRGGTADAAGDHRLAMSFAIAALGARRECTIQGAEAVSISYPQFFPALESLRA